MIVFVFNHTVSLGCVNTRTLMNNIMSLQIISKDRIEEISGIVCFEDLNVCFKLFWIMMGKFLNIWLVSYFLLLEVFSLLGCLKGSFLNFPSRRMEETFSNLYGPRTNQPGYDHFVFRVLKFVIGITFVRWSCCSCEIIVTTLATDEHHYGLRSLQIILTIPFVIGRQNKTTLRYS